MMKPFISATVIRNKDFTCREDGCNNTEFNVDWALPHIGHMVCKKHYDEYVKGVTK